MHTIPAPTYFLTWDRLQPTSRHNPSLRPGPRTAAVRRRRPTEDRTLVRSLPFEYGRAGRPQFDNQGVAVILVHEPKKTFYRKFLYEPFPVESCLQEQLHDHFK